jgi:hypothetical protein
MSNIVRMFLIIITNIFVEDLSKIDETIKKLKNSLLYNIYQYTTASPVEAAVTPAQLALITTYTSDTFYNRYIKVNINDTDIEELDLSKTSILIKSYKQNLFYIDIILNEVYKEFLMKFREEIVKLLNITDINCDEKDYINIDSKLNQFVKKLYKMNSSFKEFNKDNFFKTVYTYKDATTEPKINIYKTLLTNSIKNVNNLFVKYLNAITIIMNKDFNNVNNLNENSLEELIINNYNFYNNDMKHIKKNFIELPITINNKYRNIYSNYKSNDLKELKHSIDNVSWSSVIMIIIFTMILIEPTVV